MARRQNPGRSAGKLTAPVDPLPPVITPAADSSALQQPARGQPETYAEEARMTGTDSRVVLPFPVSERSQKPQVAPVSKPCEVETFAHVSKPVLPTDFAHVGKIEQPSVFSTLWGAGANPVWRPKKFVRDDSYPKVTASGFYFRKDSGGFALIRRSDRKCVGFYTKLSIQELEKQHGSKSKTAKPKPGRA